MYAYVVVKNALWLRQSVCLRGVCTQEMSVSRGSVVNIIQKEVSNEHNRGSKDYSAPTFQGK